MGGDCTQAEHVDEELEVDTKNVTPEGTRLTVLEQPVTKKKAKRVNKILFKSLETKNIEWTLKTTWFVGLVIYIDMEALPVPIHSRIPVQPSLAKQNWENMYPVDKLSLSFL